MNKYFLTMLALAATVSMVSCGDDDDDLSSTTTTPEETEEEEVEDETTEEEITSKYPSNAIVWEEGTTVTLTDHFLVPKDSALYIEPGVTVIADNGDVKPEIVVLGNLYAMGTEDEPILFTVADEYQTDRFSRMWGGIICGYDSEEVLLSHTIIEYGGAITTEESLSFQYSLFKTETGEGVPAFHFCNTEGQFVITDCIFRNNAEDQIYITGGNSIVMNNILYSNGYDGGEAINYKSGCQSDIAYNLIYDANTNGFKLSNTGLSVDTEASHLVVYNNTIVNTGWRRPKVKGGSIWLESNIYAELYNNLIYDCRWGLKHDTSDPENSKCVITPNYYFASTQDGVDQMQADEDSGILNGDDDIMSATPGDMDPLFVNFTQQSNIDINTGADETNAPVTFDESWDFHLQASSPALTGGNTSFTRLYASDAISFEGLISQNDEEMPVATSYTSPAPGEHFGSFGEE